MMFHQRFGRFTDRLSAVLFTQTGIDNGMALPPKTAQRIALLWGVGGVIALCLKAVISLFPKVLEALEHELSIGQIAAGGLWVLFMAVMEGYRGFQQRFSPRVVRRGHWLGQNPTPGRLLLAPLFCMGLIGATRKRMIGSWALLCGITVLVGIVGQIPQPWRGLVDAGVVVGLSWGMASIIAWQIALARGREPDISLDLPAGEVSEG